MADCLNMEFMDFTVPLPLSLLETSANAVVVSMWTPDYVIAVLKEMMKKRNMERYNEDLDFRDLKVCKGIFKKIRKTINRIEVPSNLKDQLYQVVIPIACQIRCWYFRLKRHELPIIYVAEKFAHRMVWLPQGGLDFEKMMLMLLEDEGIAPESRLRLACYYSDDEMVKHISEKINFRNKNLEVIRNVESPVVAYRIHVISNKFQDLVAYHDSKNEECSFEVSLMKEDFFYQAGFKMVGNVWSMLNYAEKLAVLRTIEMFHVGVEIIKFMKDIRFADVSENLKVRNILRLLLKWPQRVHFKRVLPLLLKHLTENHHYTLLLEDIYQRLAFHKLDRFYEDLPKFVWDSISMGSRNKILHNQEGEMSELICHCQHTLNWNYYLEMLLENATTDQKEKIYGRIIKKKGLLFLCL